MLGLLVGTEVERKLFSDIYMRFYWIIKVLQLPFSSSIYLKETEIQQMGRDNYSL